MLSYIKNLPALSTPVLTALASGTGAIDLSWADISNESSYRLERSTAGGGSWTQIGGTISAGTTTYNDTGLSTGTIYWYRIKGVGDNVSYSDGAYSEIAIERTWGTALSITQQVTGNNTGGVLAISLVGTAAGCLLVYRIAQENSETQVASPGTVTSSPALTWSPVVTKGADASGNAVIWYAFFAAGGNITCTATWGTVAIAGVVSEVANSEAEPAGAKAAADDQTNPSVDITTTRYGSIVLGVTCDFSATDGATRTLRDSATEDFYHFASGSFTAYFYHKDVTTRSTRTMGVSAPTFGSQAGGTCLLEIRTA